jgi:hypothetical protein
MHDLTRHFALFACALCVLALGPTASHAQNAGDTDKREIAAYKLTDAGLDKYVQATRNLKGVKINDCDEGSDSPSINEAVAMMDAAPNAKAAVQSAGMTTREYIVFTFSLIANRLAVWAMDQPGGKLPPGVSLANVDFLRAHAADMEKLGEELGGATCDDEGEDENGG